MAKQKKTAKKEQPLQYGYGWQKLHAAVRALVGQEDQRARLRNAISILTLLHANDYETHIPPELLDDFRTLVEEVPAGPLSEYVNGLGDDAINEKAQEILDFYDAVCRHCPPVA